MKNYSIELLRFIAVVLIVFTHTRNNFPEDSIAHIFLVEIPRHGTVVLSIISGYLFWTVSYNSDNLLKKKIKSLLIPYLIANLSVLIIVILINKLGVNYLNRLTYDCSLISEGILSLNSAPINPPTNFIRDLFIIFFMIEIIKRKSLLLLGVLVLIAVFGKLLLRYDVLIMFGLGVLFAKYRNKLNRKIILITLFLLSVILMLFFSDYSKYAVSMLIFVLFVSLPVRFFYVGGYTYLLHLYHSPIMVVAAPFILAYTHNPYLSVIFQVLLALLFTGVLFLFIQKFTSLKIITGGR